MIEVINEQDKPVTINVEDISIVEKRYYRGCVIIMKNGETVITEHTSYETLVRMWKELLAK